MRKLIQIKKILTFLLVFTALSFCGSVRAIDCSGYHASIDSGATPYLSDLVCPLVRIINAALIVVAGVFIIVVVYGAIKASMALGDPKALKGAHQTWLYAAIGLAVVLLSSAIIVIVLRIFGINIGGPTQWLDSLQEALRGVQNNTAYN